MMISTTNVNKVFPPFPHDPVVVESGLDPEEHLLSQEDYSEWVQNI